MVKNNTRATVCCDCGKTIEIPYSTYRYYTRTLHPIRCRECSRKFMSNKTSNNWNSKTPEEKLEWGKRTKENWKKVSYDTKQRLSKSRSIARKEHWKSMSAAEKKTLLNKMNDGFRTYWNTLDASGKELHAQRSVQQWNSLTDEQKLRKIKRLHDGHKSWFNSLTKEELDTFSKQHSDIAKDQWDKMGTAERTNLIRRVLSSSSRKNNGLHRKFEHRFNESNLSRSFYIIPECSVCNNGTIHFWDYGIFNENCELVAVVDLDGAFYHGDNDDYDGIHSREEYDEIRSLSVPEGIFHCIINELRFNDCFKYLMELLLSEYQSYVNSLFKEMRSQPFPEPHYTDSELTKVFTKLQRMNCNDTYHQDLSLNTRIGDRLIQHFHPSIWRDHRKGELSPYDAWMDDTLLRKCIENRIIYQTHLNPNKILQGFNVSKIAPKVSVFSAGRAKMIISRYLQEFDTIFDPFSGYSGRMLGTISLGKRYIGQDLSLIHVNESNNLMDFLRSKGIEFQAEITQKDILQSTGEYPCLFTCPPYGDKEQWQDVPVDTRTCDDWIDECISRFKCRRYVFVVDNTTKYTDKVVDVIKNKSHFGGNEEKIILVGGN